MSQRVYGRACIVFLILINQFQVALGVRLNYFQMAFGNAIQVPDEAHRVAFWHQLIDVFTPLAIIIIAAQMIEFYVASNFVLQWRRWMTASYTSRWLLNSMHYKLALGGHTADNPDQRISQDVGSFLNGAGTVANSGNVGIYNYSIRDDLRGDQSRRLLDHPVGPVARHGPCRSSALKFPACCSGWRRFTRCSPPASCS